MSPGTITPLVVITVAPLAPAWLEHDAATQVMLVPSTKTSPAIGPDALITAPFSKKRSTAPGVIVGGGLVMPPVPPVALVPPVPPPPPGAPPEPATPPPPGAP